MLELLQMAAILGGLYILYALTIKKWNYTTEAQRKARRELLKQKGLSNTFYFIHERTLLLLNLFSGGLFSLFWLFRQWQAARRGYKRLDGQPLKTSPLWRTILFPWSFFELNALINRICEYMHHIPAFPPFVWGTAWLVCLAGIFLAPGWWKFVGYFGWCWIPSVLQNRLNALSPQALPKRPQAAEVVACVTGFLLTVGVVGAVLIIK